MTMTQEQRQGVTKLGEAIKQAVTTRDPELAGKVAGFLMYHVGLNYDQTYQLVNSVTPVDVGLWGELLYYANVN
jgi:hypothetical protein